MNLQQSLANAAAFANKGRFEQAARLCRQILARIPGQPDANHFLGQILLSQGAAAAAVPHLQVVVGQRPGDPAARYHLGRALLQVGRDEAAIAEFEAATAIDPFEVATHVDLGVARARIGRNQDAAAAFAAALKLAPTNVTALIGRSRLAQLDGDHESARTLARRALAADPHARGAAVILAAVARESGAGEEAARVLAEARERDPDDIELLIELLSLETERGRIAEAMASAEALQRLAPAVPATWYLAAQARIAAADIDGAIADYGRGMDLEPLAGVAAGHGSSLVMSLQYSDAVSRDGLLRAHAAWEERHARRVPQANRFPNHRDPDRRLRVGFVSPDFRLHSVALFFAPYLELHDRAAFETFCYSTQRRSDSVTTKLREWSEHWRAADRGDSADLAAMVRADGIDILVDLAGHTVNNRLLVFAMHPAPVQVTWLGYPGTTGLKAIDWRIGDAICDPVEDDPLGAERVCRLEHGFHPYVPPPEDAPVRPRDPAAPITFGSFNNYMKLSPTTLEIWARIMAATPGSRLVLKSSGARTGLMGEAIVAKLADRGIDPARVTMLPHQGDFRAHLALYAGIDIGLDPTPYCGTTTTCEALWMGVPVVTLKGDRHAARVGASLLTQVGLPELIATNVDDYVRIATGLAADGPRLAVLRAGMRDRLRASPLLDTYGFARRFEAALRDMWRQWCAQP